MEKTIPIAESKDYIILEKYTKIEETAASYQTEANLEDDLLADLQNQGYEYLSNFDDSKMVANVRKQLQLLNDVIFTDSEWQRFLDEYLDKTSDNLIDKTRKIHDNHIHDFIFDDGHIQNIKILDKKNPLNNKLQVINQFEQNGRHANRYDVTILVNGLPLVQIELKKRGVAIQEAFNQIHRYSKESFNVEHSLYKYLQIFVISNGTDTRYFANTTKRDKNSFDFTMNWALADNAPIKDLKDFTATFFQVRTLLDVLIRYSVFDVNDTLLIMRPYQIAATERILWKIQSSYNNKNWSKPDSGGYIWHTTGSGKTLTSFKAAQLATHLDFIDKVFFVVDRKDLDYQTMKEYQRFSPDSVNGSDSTEGLRRNIEKSDNKIIVTTIQKLNHFLKTETHEVYNQQVVLIFDEAHRSQFGEAQKNIQKKFKKYYQFGFTGTPIFPENALGSETTQSVFGRELHHYIITDAIRDEKVLKFRVDYNDVRPQFKAIESEQDVQKLSAYENKKALLHPKRISEISRYVLNNFNQKTHRYGDNGFNAMFAVSSVEAAKLYYEELQKQQKDKDKPLTIATIFSYAANEEQNAIGDIVEENFEPSAMDLSAKEFLSKAISDYNLKFKQSYSVEGKQFQNYYRDLAKNVKNRKVDLLIVVGMFLTGFDAPMLNTLFVDKNLRYHGLIQAYSRTNRIFDKTKSSGNIVTFRDLQSVTETAIKLFGKTSTADVIMEKSYTEYMNGYTDEISGKVERGYLTVVAELQERFPLPDEIEKERDKKDFTKLFGEYLRLDNNLQNYDDYVSLQAYQTVDKDDNQALEKFKERYYLTDEQVKQFSNIEIPSVRKIQDYRSTYNDIRNWLRREQENGDKSKLRDDWDDVVFEVDLLQSQEINLDYILTLILDTHKKGVEQTVLIDEIARTIRASVGNRAKESLIIDFINQADLDIISEKSEIIQAFFNFAQAEQQREIDELIELEKLNETDAKRYILTSLRHEYATDNGDELTKALPKMSPLNPEYLTKKQTVFEKISALVEKFKGVGGTLK